LDVKQVWNAWNAGLFAKSGRCPSPGPPAPPAPPAEPSTVLVPAADFAVAATQDNLLVDADLTHVRVLPDAVAVAPAFAHAAPAFAAVVAADEAVAGMSAATSAIPAAPMIRRELNDVVLPDFTESPSRLWLNRNDGNLRCKIKIGPRRSWILTVNYRVNQAVTLSPCPKSSHPCPLANASASPSLVVSTPL